jgi:hypothetical protein
VSSAPAVCGNADNYHEMSLKVSELFYAPSGVVVGSRIVIELVVWKLYNYERRRAVPVEHEAM